VKYLGIDWATKSHVLVMIDEHGAPLWERSVSHDWSAVQKLLKDLEQYGGPDQVTIGIESGARRLARALAGAGHTVYEINPKQSDRFRDRFSPSGAKDDRRDALVLASAVRTDGHRMRPLRAPSELDGELQARCRSRVSLVAQRTRLMQQLRVTLHEYHPAILALARPLSGEFVLSLLRSYPDPARAARAQRRGLSKLLRTHRIRVLDVEQLRTLLRVEPFPMPAGEVGAWADRALDLASAIEGLNHSIQQAEHVIAHVFSSHPDRDIYMSLPGIGVLLAPYLAAEIALALGRLPQSRALQALAGTSPVTRRTGKQTQGRVSMRKQCHRGLQAALFTVARCSRGSAGWAAAYFAWKRERGVRSNIALRSLSNKWVKILCKLLETRELYDEERHTDNLRRSAVPWAPEAAQAQGVAA